MQTLTRRHLVKLAVTTSAVTTATALLGDTSQAVVSSTPASSKSGGFSPDLCGYVTNGILTVAAKVHKRTATQEDVQTAASHARLLAKHLQDCGMDDFLAKSLPTTASATTVGGDQLPGMDTYRKVVAQYMPGFDPVQAFPATPASQSDVQSAYDQVRKVGVAGMFYAHADQLQRFSGRLTPATAYAVAPASWSDGVYRPDLFRAHLVSTQACGNINSTTSATSIIEEVCKGVGFATFYLSTALSYVLAACENNPEAFVYCSSLAARVAALGLTLSAGTWVGLSLAAIAVLLYFFCN